MRYDYLISILDPVGLLDIVKPDSLLVGERIDIIVGEATRTATSVRDQESYLS